MDRGQSVAADKHRLKFYSYTDARSELQNGAMFMWWTTVLSYNQSPKLLPRG